MKTIKALTILGVLVLFALSTRAEAVAFCGYVCKHNPTDCVFDSNPCAGCELSGATCSFYAGCCDLAKAKSAGFWGLPQDEGGNALPKEARPTDIQLQMAPSKPAGSL